MKVYLKTLTLNSETDSETLIQGRNISKLETMTLLKVSETEVLIAMKNNNYKSPRSDGFTAEFHKFLWIDLKTYITIAINQIFIKQQLHAPQR